jgi:hypothetical protein
MPLNDQLLQIVRTSETSWDIKSVLPVSFATLLLPEKTEAKDQIKLRKYILFLAVYILFPCSSHFISHQGLLWYCAWTKLYLGPLGFRTYPSSCFVLCYNSRWWSKSSECYTPLSDPFKFQGFTVQPYLSYVNPFFISHVSKNSYNNIFPSVCPLVLGHIIFSTTFRPLY